MKQEKLPLQVGGVAIVKGKKYLVVAIAGDRVICRRFEYTKKGHFKEYQDFNFPLKLCKRGDIRDEKFIHEQRRQAILQRNCYSQIRSTVCNSLIC
jgi:hypothetical protein